MRSPAIKVVLASEVRMHLEALALQLASEPRLDLLVSADSVAHAIRAAIEHAADVVLLDLAPTPGNLAALAEAATASPTVHFVALGVAETDEAVAWAEAGVTGFLEPGHKLHDLPAVLESVMRGELHCSPQMAAALVRRLRELNAERRQGPLGHLTPREAEILELIGKGLSNTEIAGRMSLRVSTVKNHVRSIFEKLGVRNRAAAVLVGLSSHRDTG